jgi:cobalt-zinc-cadmium efflux system membrane fusion protein
MLRPGHLTVFLVAALALAGCGERSAPAAPAAKARVDPLRLDPEAARAAGVRVAALAPEPIAEEIRVTANIQPNQDRLAHVEPRSAGRIVAVAAKLGDRVAAGQTLAELDSIELGLARSAYVEAGTELELARAAYERAERLFAAEVIAEKDLLRARADVRKAEAAQRAAADRLQMLGGNPGAQRDGRSSVFRLVAPIAGTVIQRDAVLGELAATDKTLFTIADLSVVWIEADVFERDLARVMPGVAASVTVAAYPGESFAGKVTHVADQLSRETRTARARVEVANADGRLKPEMFATVAIRTGSNVEALMVPEEAVVLVAGQSAVFVERDGRFVPQPVELGARAGGRAVVRSGLAAGDRVAVGGAYELKARLLKSQLATE